MNGKQMKTSGMAQWLILLIALLVAGTSGAWVRGIGPFYNDFLANYYAYSHPVHVVGGVNANQP